MPCPADPRPRPGCVCTRPSPGPYPQSGGTMTGPWSQGPALSAPWRRTALWPTRVPASRRATSGSRSGPRPCSAAGCRPASWAAAAARTGSTIWPAASMRSPVSYPMRRPELHSPWWASPTEPLGSRLRVARRTARAGAARGTRWAIRASMPRRGARFGGSIVAREYSQETTSAARWIWHVLRELRSAEALERCQCPGHPPPQVWDGSSKTFHGCRVTEQLFRPASQCKSAPTAQPGRMPCHANRAPEARSAWMPGFVND